MKRLPLAVLAILVVLAVMAGGAIWRLGDLRSQGATLTPNSSADALGGPFALIDQFGKRRTDKDFRGKFMLVFFGYTYCPDICPTTLAVEAEALDRLGARANRIAPIFISVDPKRDTPEKLKSYLASFDAKPPSTRPGFIGLTGSEAEIAAAAKAYRVYYRAHLDARAEDGANYAIDHSTDIYLMNGQGKFLAYYSAGILPDEMAADLMKKTVSPP
jgi:protein SCO1/2